MLSVSDRSRWLWEDMRAVCALEGNSRSDHASIDGVLPSSRANARWVSPPMDWGVLHDYSPTYFSLLSRDWSIKFVHAYRESNAVADSLTKSVVLGSLEFCIFVDPPHFIFALLQVDCMASG
ncbi:hypothetical protein V6N12_073185 [Hibiscus sabdariffa]|uniref:RNase H type-1 domain-containing protein n=1 Tax=Hibiscus sabdariffa TaxID=183260 RepID=A0ABR2B6W6_9ROSI